MNVLRPTVRGLDPGGRLRIALSIGERSRESRTSTV